MGGPARVHSAVVPTPVCSLLFHLLIWAQSIKIGFRICGFHGNYDTPIRVSSDGGEFHPPHSLETRDGGFLHQHRPLLFVFRVTERIPAQDKYGMGVAFLPIPQ